MIDKSAALLGGKRARTASDRRASFAQINASWAIEGQVMDTVDLAMQEQLVRGEITHEQAIEEVKRRYRIGSANIDRS